MSSNHSDNESYPVGTPCDDLEWYTYLDYTQLTPVRHLFVSLYVIVITLSLCGNAMVILTVSRNKHMRTVTNCYLVNLAVSDSLVAACVMPLKALEYAAPAWEWSVFSHNSLCSLLYFALPVFVFASVLTLIAISIERYYAVVHPINAKIFTSKRRTIKVIASTWVVAIVCALPYLHCKSYAFSISSPLGSVSRYICTDRFDDIDEWMYGSAEQESGGRFRKGFFMFLFVTMYVVPSAVILFTCVRIAVALGRPVSDILNRSSAVYKVEDNKRKIARMVIVIAVTFLVLWSPFYLVTFISQVQSVSFLKSQNFLFTMLLVHLIGFTNSAVNPFVYALLGDKFRTAFVRLMIDVVSAVCCLSFTERGRRIRRQWLATTGTSFVSGTGGGTTAHSEMSSVFVRHQFVQKSDLEQRRTGWSSRRSYTASELIGKQKTKVTAATVIGGNRVWNDRRQSSRTSNEPPITESHHEAASTTLHGQVSAAIEPENIKPEIECAREKTSVMRDYGRAAIEKPETVIVGSGVAGDEATDFFRIKQMRKVTSITTGPPPSGTDDCRQHGRCPSAGNSVEFVTQFKVHSISLPDIASG